MMTSLARRFRSNNDGVAAVEFIVVLPVFLLLLLGSFELMRALMAHKKTQKIPYTVDQLITKAPALSADLIESTLAASTSVMAPFDTSGIAIDLTYRYIDASGKVSESWSLSFPEGKGQSAPAELPATYSSLREVGYLQTHVHYAYRATFPSLFFDKVDMSAESIVRPRPGMPLSCADC